MATQYDIAFLKVLMRDTGADKSVAMRCIQVIDDQARQGRTVNAMQAAIQMGLVDQGRARQVDAATRQELSSGNAPTQLSGVYSLPPAPAPLPSSQPLESGDPDAMRTIGFGEVILTPGGGGKVQLAPPGPPPSDPDPDEMPTVGFGQIIKPPGQPPPPPAPIDPLDMPLDEGIGGQTMMFDNVMPAMSLAAPPPPVAEEEFFDLEEHGTGLDDFELGSQLRADPLGDVYRGRRKSDGANVEIRVLPRRLTKHEDLLQQILADVRQWSFDDARVTRSLAVGEAMGRNVVVYSKAQGTQVGSRIMQGPMDPGQALRVVYDVARALAEAHKRGLSHGDIRAETVFFDGIAALLVDPGLARASCLAAGFGQFGMPFGHPAYIAPEVIRNHQKRPTPAGDVYALGILAYQLLCGKLPFPLTSDLLAVIKQHYEAPLPPPPENVTFSTAIATLVMRMTAKDLGNRLSGPDVVVDGIEQLLAGKPLELPPPRTGPAQPEKEAPEQPVSSKRWTDKIKLTSGMVETFSLDEIEAVGPAEWTPDAEDEPEESGGLLNAIKEAAGDPAAARKRARKGKKAGKGKGKKKGYSVGQGGPLAARRSGNAKRFVATLLTAILVVGGLGGATVYRLFSKAKPKAAAAEAAKAQAKVKGPDPKQEAALKAELDQAKLIGSELAEYRGNVSDALAAGRFRKALGLHESLSEETRATAKAKALIADVGKRARQASAAKFKEYSAVVEDLIQRGELSAAERKLKSVRAWIINRDGLQRLRAKLRAHTGGRMAELRKLRLSRPIPNLPIARSKLEKSLQGKVTLLPNGGLAVSYAEGKGLHEDLVRISRGKPHALEWTKVPAAGTGKGLHVSAGRKPVILSSRIPLWKVLDVRLTVVLTRRPTFNSRLAVLIGVRSRRRKEYQGTGVDWGVVPVELQPDGTLVNQSVASVPKLALKTPLRFEIAVSGHKTSTLSIRGKVRQGPAKPLKGSAAKLSRKKAWGYVGLYVERADAYITSFEVRGLVNPKALK